MNLKDIRKQVIYHLTVDDMDVHRYNENSWTYTIYYNIHSEECEILDPMRSELEKLFQEHREIIE